jgi:hypothetical protein
MTFPIGPLEISQTRLSFALLLRDRLTLADALEGDVGVTSNGRPGIRKAASGTFVFFGLPGGPAKITVRSSPDTPYYLPLDLNVTIPQPPSSWPAFPDISVANPNLMLSDPAQPPAYRTQFLQSCLAPAVTYPFDAAATLVRGTVLHGDAPVPGVTMLDPADSTVLPYVTAVDGQFVLIFQTPEALPTNVTIQAQQPGRPNVNTSVILMRASTATVRIQV